MPINLTTAYLIGEQISISFSWFHIQNLSWKQRNKAKVEIKYSIFDCDLCSLIFSVLFS